MADEWFYAKDGQQAQGPISSAQLKQLAAGGQVGTNDLVWKQGMPQWVPASQVKGLLGGSTDQRAMPSSTRLPEVAQASAPAAPAPPSADPAAAGSTAPPMGTDPWYFRKIEQLTRYYFFLGVGLAGVSLLYFTYHMLQGIFSEFVRGWARVEMIGILLFFVIPIHIFAAIASAITAGLFLAAVDGARNLRAIRGNTPGS